VTPLECLQYALSLPTSVVITGVDSMPILDQAFEAAKTYSSLSKADIEGILKKTVTVAADGKYEPFKTTPIFDSTAAHPEGWDTRLKLKTIRAHARTERSVVFRDYSKN
jgi:hypothetical protein